ncbi:LysR substrate-binding domain-containing protein [Aeromonas enteropelogenes]|uniref:LysR substrate-binding domain-containing protein n=1 Tax=Aeromonas enteropelogenes TaxID=29489 RepID=UPI0031362969
MVITADAIKVVIVIARCGSFAAASQELHKVPSALSYTLHKLEDALGVSLFERQGKQLVLTEVGYHFIKRGELILGELGSLEDSTRLIAMGVEPAIRLSFNNILSLAPLTPLLRECEALFPQTEIQLAIDVHDGVWDALLAKRADIAVGAPNQVIANSEIGAEPMGMVEWVFAVSPRHPVAQLPQPLTERTLRRYPAICIRDTSVQLKPKEAWLLRGQKALQVPDFHSKLALQAEGIGIGFVPRHFGQPLIDDGRLQVMTVEAPKQSTPLFLAWQRQHTRPCFSWWLRQLRDPVLQQGLLGPLG